MKRKRIFWVVITLLVVIMAAGYSYYATARSQATTSQRQVSTEATTQMAVARAGDLTVSVSGSGELVPHSTIELSFPESGELVTMNVKLGEEVQAGQVLASLRVDQSPVELAAEIASAELALITAQQKLDQLYEDVKIEAAQALLAVEEAQQALDELKNNAGELALAQQSLAQAKGAIADAEMQFYILNSSPSQEAIDIAYSSLLFKEKDLNELEAQIEKLENQIKSAPNQKIREGLKMQLLNLRVQRTKQQLEVDDALYKYNTIDDPTDPLDLTVAEAQLNAAQAQLEAALQNWEEQKAGPSSGDLALAEAKMSEAQVEWERLAGGPDSDNIALAEVQLRDAQLNLALAQQGKSTLDLVAPLHGTVIAINAAVGDRVNQQTVLTLADISQPTVKVVLDETDLQNIQVGLQTEVVFDALPDTIFTGQVVQVDPSLQSVGNSQAVQALVELDAGSDLLNKLPLGLNATVDIIVGQVEKAILVPVEAIQAQPDGGFILYIVKDDGVEIRSVQVGLTDLTTAEITIGLEPGERVALGDPNLDQE